MTIVSIALAISLQSCAAKGPASAVISEARIEISLARRAGAEELAPGELDEARDLISQAESALADGEVEKATHLAEMALLKARYARLKASYKRAREELERERAELEALRAELGAVRKAREEAEAELKRIEEGEE